MQRRLHGLVTEKIATQDQLAELTAFGAQLQSAAARLAEDGTWRLVHAHFSVGVPDIEVVALQLR